MDTLVVPCVEAYGFDEILDLGRVVGKVVGADPVGEEGLGDADFGALTSLAFVFAFRDRVAVGVGERVPGAAVVGLDDELLAHAADGTQSDALEAMSRRVQGLVDIQVVGRVAMTGEILVAMVVDSVTVVRDMDGLETGVGYVDADVGSTGVNGVFYKLSRHGGDVVNGLIVQDKVTELQVELGDGRNGGHDGQREMKHWLNL